MRKSRRRGIWTGMSAASAASAVSAAALAVLAATLFLGESAVATPVKGINECLNDEDCLGANRRCHRNLTMSVGLCTCEKGFRQAIRDMVKCLNISSLECDSQADCDGLDVNGLAPPGVICMLPPLATHMQPDGGRLLSLLLPKKCHFYYGGDLSSANRGQVPRTGGGLRPSGEFLDHYYTFGRRNRIHADSFDPLYTKFVEDAMLVLFLMCVLVTLFVVHRASCHRQFSQSRRNGPLRYILPHRDDRPPPYSEPASGGGGAGGGADANADNIDSAGNAYADGNSIVVGSGESPTGSSDGRCGTAAMLVRHFTGRGKGTPSVGRRGETPPPTYDEALLIAQSRNAPVPLYISLPAEAGDSTAPVHAPAGRREAPARAPVASAGRNRPPPSPPPPFSSFEEAGSSSTSSPSRARNISEPRENLANRGARETPAERLENLPGNVPETRFK